MADPFTYLELSGFRELTTMPPELVDALEARHSGWLHRQCAIETAHINVRLSKRYATPFKDPYPLTVLEWIERKVTARAYTHLGSQLGDEEIKRLNDAADKAETEIKEAADSNTGLFDLPLRADTSTSGISRGDPLSYSEAGPYEWTDVQRRAVSNGG